MSPHIALILNIFPEHLDYYETMDRYVASKARSFNIREKDDIPRVRFGSEADRRRSRHTERKPHAVTWSAEPDETYPYTPCEEGATLAIKDGETTIPFYDPSVKTSINGKHVLARLLLAGVAACYAGGEPERIAASLPSFQGLPHRLENIGEWKGITFINDSISTIPESALAALKAYPQTNILILGGLDRGISYKALVDAITHTRELSIDLHRRNRRADIC